VGVLAGTSCFRVMRDERRTGKPKIETPRKGNNAIDKERREKEAGLRLIQIRKSLRFHRSHGRLLIILDSDFIDQFKLRFEPIDMFLSVVQD